jgi:hypothetical protein
MSRTIVLLAALAIAAPASAATYAGKPVTPVSDGKFVARDIVWSNSDGIYQGSTAESRPLVLCQSLAKRTGRLESFTVDGKALADADLAKCNSAAPAGSTSAVAEAN